MPMKFDHVVTTIIESHDTDTLSVAELQGSIESHVNRILEKTEKVKEEALKSQLNFNNVDGSQNFIGDVFYAPGLHHNLLSMRQLSEKGYNMQIHNGFCTLIDRNGRFITKYVKLVKLERSIEIFPTGKSWRARKLLEIVHSDLCSVEIPTPGGCRIKALRTDRGQEYLAGTNFFEQHGIEHQLTTRYTAQQNGVAERKNRTIMDIVRCMLKTKQIPKEFWGRSSCYCSIYFE
ncbi:putative copia-like retrotransposable element [Trifolium pratense]|uniref:Putative copia-like retrotransposable element n=1 Tax=Trifolium pratense TaxID=57577 RepID=A0A2K3LAP2_TRIPR|nr:putative copia-like retrotransposable element [Trifolium pratense]